ncbi:hypothetical protein SprV_0501955600 [Sparganum proliferum]
MGLYGHMRTYKSGICRSLYTPNTSHTSTVPNPAHTPSLSAPTISSSATADYSWPHRPRTFTSPIDLVGHLRIHRTEADEPVPGTPTHQTHPPQLPSLPHTFSHRIGLLGHMRIYDNLRYVTAAYSTSSSTNTHITQHHHPSQTSIATSHASGKCVSQTLLHATPLPHVCDQCLCLSRCAERCGLEGCQLTPKSSPRSLPSSMCLHGVADWWAESQAIMALSQSYL